MPEYQELHGVRSFMPGAQIHLLANVMEAKDLQDKLVALYSSLVLVASLMLTMIVPMLHQVPAELDEWCDRVTVSKRRVYGCTSEARLQVEALVSWLDQLF